MSVFKYHAFIFLMRPPRWRTEHLYISLFAAGYVCTLYSIVYVHMYIWSEENPQDFIIKSTGHFQLLFLPNCFFCVCAPVWYANFVYMYSVGSNICILLYRFIFVRVVFLLLALVQNLSTLHYVCVPVLKNYYS